MIGFLAKGLLRDRSRSLFPFIVVALGVMLAVFLYSWIQGELAGTVGSVARLATGHVKVMSRAYAREADQIPNDLAYIGVSDLLAELRRSYPDMTWTPRIRFGGLLDVPDENGETRAQGPAAGLAVDLLSPNAPEPGILNLAKAVTQGRLPQARGEILVSSEFARRLGIKPGSVATLFGSTMYGSTASANFTVVGLVRFGVTAMDRGAMIADIGDIQSALDMTDAAGEIVGYSPNMVYDPVRAKQITDDFNVGRGGGLAAHEQSKGEDDFAPVMLALRDQNNMDQMIDIHASMTGIIVAIFLTAMAIVLWNAGLLGSLRRYGEFGVRLAIGEAKGHLYRSLLGESLLIGLAGSVAGTLVGVLISWILQTHGFNVAGMMRNSSIMMPEVIRARVTPLSWIVGFAPGVLATIVGAAISGLDIFRRETAKLVKELET